MDGLKARLSFDAVAYDYDDEYLTIDTDTHTININNVSRLFGVQYDGNSKLIKFRIRNKLSDIQKMQDSIVYINWIDSRGVKGQSIAINKTINNDTCEFAWKVPFDALKNSGVLHFAMSAVMTKNSSSVIDQRWSTQIASVITPDGIYIKSYTPSSEEEDRIAQIYNELSNMINKLNDNLQSQVNSLKEDLANTASVTFTYDPSKVHSSTVDKINLSTKKGELYTLYVTNNKNLTSHLFMTVYEYNGKTGSPKEEHLPFFSARSFVSNGCDSVGIWMPQNMFTESCEVTFTLKRELYEKVEDLYNKINGFSQCTDILYIPSIVNGSTRNKVNETCISVSKIIPTNGAKTIKVYTTIPLPEGYHYHYTLSIYKNGGNPREEELVNFVDDYVKTQDNTATFDVSGFDYFAFDLYIKDSSDYKYPVRMSNNIIEKPFLISYEYPIDKFAMSNEIIKMERGLIANGKYESAVNKQYIRSKYIMKVNQGDWLTIGVSDKLSGGYQYNLYKYSNADENTIIESQLINNITNPKSKTIRFDKSCYISIRATLAPVHDLSDEEVNVFMKLFSIHRNFICSDIDELHTNVNALKKQINGYGGFLNIDYNTLKNEMDGNINIAVQADTHACAFDTYKNNGTKVYPSNFETFRTVLNTIEKLGCDATTNLGDIVQGYEFDADFETRESLEKIIQTYSETLTQKPLYVIGNHDDGNLFYYDTSYNDKKDVSNVLYPYEQFQRITKNGVNGKNNKNYYYADIKGVRFITLYQRDFNYSEKIPSIEQFCISQTQIEWFKNDALNTTNPIIVLTHAPLVSELFVTGGTGFAEILTALQTFKANGGIIIAVLNGHTHKQDQAVVDGINHIVFANGYSFFEIMSVNLSTKTIKCKPINNSTLQERTFSY